MWEKENPYSLLVGLQTSAAMMEISVENYQKPKNNLPHGPAMSLLNIYPKASTSYS